MYSPAKLINIKCKNIFINFLKKTYFTHNICVLLCTLIEIFLLLYGNRLLSIPNEGTGTKHVVIYALTSETTTTKDKPKPEKKLFEYKNSTAISKFFLFWKVWFYTILYFIYLLKQRVLNTEFYSCIKLNLSRWKIKIMSDMMCIYPSYMPCLYDSLFYKWMSETHEKQQHFKVIAKHKGRDFRCNSKNN